MTYQVGGKIEASDINTHINGVNSILSDKGLATLPTITAGQVVRASDWASVTGAVANLANYHGVTYTVVNTPTAGYTASYLNALSTNITAVNNSKRNTRAQGTTVSTAVASGSWFRSITVTQTVAFASAAAAQYFFNAGGQIAIKYTHPSGTGINGIFNALADAIGVLTISSPNSGTVSIAGKNYAGFDRSGTAGTPSPFLPNAGYYGLSGTSQTLFKLLGGSYTNPAPGGGSYSANYIQLDAFTSGSGATINLVSTWSESTTGGLPTSGNSTTTVTLIPPATTYINGYYSGNPPWGTPTLTSNPIVGG